jgi:hypothetical protein
MDEQVNRSDGVQQSWQPPAARSLDQRPMGYAGKRQFVDDFPYIIDELGISHTDAVRRAIGAAIFNELFSTKDLIVH